MPTRTRCLSLLLVLALLLPSLASCSPGGLRREPTVTPIVPLSGGGGRVSPANVAPNRVGSALGATQGGVTGMTITLGEGVDTPPPPETLRVLTGQPLSEAATAALLRRLPALEGAPDDAQAFRLPAETLKPPRPGETVEQPFPPTETGDDAQPVEAGPLQVLRFSPEGDVPLAPFLSVTFSQPMVPLGTIAQLAAQDVPVRLTPQPEGAWRWVGTQTLLFEPITRFPMATEYQVEVPAGVRSATGGELAEAVRWIFSTPPVQLVRSHPNDGPTARQPLIWAAFDQRIDPAALLETITLAAGGRNHAVRLATAAEVQADATVSALAKAAGDGRWIALMPVEPLPAATTVSVNIGPDAPSDEGALLNKGVQSFTFSTYGPLLAQGIQCGWGNECPPLAPWSVQFTNPLDEAAFDPALVTVSPALPDLSVAAMGNSITIRGRSAGRTTYTVTVRAGLRDAFGQTLAEDARLTVKVGAAYPVFNVPGEAFVVLDPAASPGLSIYSVNYDAARVRAYAVEPADWPAYQAYLRTATRDTSADTPPGRKVRDERLPIRAEADAMVETVIDLADLKAKGHRHLILVIEPEQGLVARLRGMHVPVTRLWVQMSDLAVDAFTDQQDVLAWATSLSTGAPLADVALELYPGGASAQTAADGLARLPLAARAQGDEPGYLVASLGDDAALLPEQAWSWGTGWVKQALDDTFRWYVWDDRQMYRPEEEVHVKGWVRHVAMERGDDHLELPGNGEISYELYDAQGNRVAQGVAALNALGGFDLSLTLPAGMNLGYANLRLWLSTAKGSTEYNHSIQVQEFRRPEFEVSASASQGPHFVGESALVTVSAQYYAGGPLPGADVDWLVRTAPGSYRPPKWDEFDFGFWTPWWAGRREWDLPEQPSVEQGYHATTDAAGEHVLRIGFDDVQPPRATVVTAEATVMDVNRQAWAASTSLLVHPAAWYVGLRSQPTFVERGDPLHVDAIVVDLDGAAIADVPITVQAVRVKWQYDRGEWQEVEVDEQLCELTSAAEPLRCTFDTPEGGTYRLTAWIADAEDRRNVTQITRWVSGGQRPTAQRVELEEVTLIPDRDEYQPGDTAEILVQAPFVPAEGLLTVRRLGLVHSERFTMDEPGHVLRVPIDEADVPNVTVQVELVGTAPRLDAAGEPDETLPVRPAYATGNLTLRVPAYARTLAVDLAPRQAELEPGGSTTLDLTVRDADGRPVPGAEVAVVVVDEAVLALTGYTLADPIAIFYPDRWTGVSDYRLRQHVLLVDPARLLDEAQAMNAVAEEAVERQMLGTPLPSAAPMAETPAMAKGMADEATGAPAPIRVRSDMNPLALFSPETPTDADGTAEVLVTVPDSLTRYRIMAVAISGASDYGKAEANLTARLPLMVRPAAPRFLNFGDRIALPVVLQNQTDAPLAVDVALAVSNLTLEGKPGLAVTVPPRDRVEVRFAVSTLQAGTARLQVAAAAGEWADAAELSLPVYTPATSEAFATYGTLDEGAMAQPIVPPADVYPQFGGLEITTSSTALQALTDAVLYLVSYPFDCSEQLASRILSIAALRDVLEAFQAEGLPPAQEIDAAVQRDIVTLQSLQNNDGGFPVWTRGRESWPFYSIHAAHALARARQKDYAVSDETIQRALAYLREIEAHYPHWYSVEVRQTLSAYALYTRLQLDDHDPVGARRLLDEAGLEGLQPEALGWIYNVLVVSAQGGDAASAEAVQRIERHLGNRVVETAGAAHFVTSFREEDAYVLLASDRRADGIILEGLMRSQPDSDLIVKIVRGLLAHRKAGHWGSTQENAFVLLALDAYFRTYEAQTPDFVARAWLGEDYVGAFQFEGRTTEYQHLLLPMDYLLAEGLPPQGGAQDLILAKEGAGRLYYRLGLRYAPTDLQLEPLDQGFVVERRYEPVDDEGDVVLGADGVWRIKAGARVRVRLTMVAPTRRYHVALADPLPAGLEPMNPALAVTGAIPQDPADQAQPYWWWRWTWYEHQNLRDQRAEAFTPLLWEGIHTYTYVARATTPGEYVAPPARAEEMYAPETFGRTGTDRVIVE